MIFIYVFIGIIVLLAILSLIMPKQYFVEKTMVMHTAVNNVFNNVANLEQYKEWNPWQKTDPNASHTITGMPKTIGHQYAWNGKKVGQGNLTIKNLEENKSVSFALQFIKPWNALADDNWQFESTGTDECRVTWSNQGDLPAPMARLMGPMIKAQLNKQFVQGLENLRKLSNG
jgi:ribosome-associated toxin RatA of RatAB toxin-antitoxin module